MPFALKIRASCFETATLYLILVAKKKMNFVTNQLLIAAIYKIRNLAIFLLKT